MFMQEYEIHLIGGSVIPAMEPFDLEGSDSLIDRFAKGDPNEIFCVGDYKTGYSIIPARSIVYISTGDVKEIYDWIFVADEDDRRKDRIAGRKCFRKTGGRV